LKTGIEYANQDRVRETHNLLRGCKMMKKNTKKKLATGCGGEVRGGERWRLIFGKQIAITRIRFDTHKNKIQSRAPICVGWILRLFFLGCLLSAAWFPLLEASGSGVTEMRGGIGIGSSSSADGSFRFNDALGSGPVQGRVG